MTVMTKEQLKQASIRFAAELGLSKRKDLKALAEVYEPFLQLGCQLDDEFEQLPLGDAVARAVYAKLSKKGRVQFNAGIDRLVSLRAQNAEA